MKEFTYTVTDKLGIHARPAGILVKETGKYKSKITIRKGEKEMDMKGILGIMSLSVKGGDTVTVKCEGDDEAEAAKALESIFKENL